MKKIMTIAIIVILSLALLIGGAGSVYADVGNNAAKITQLPWARLPLGDSGLLVDLWTFDDAWQVETNSGNVILIAHFDIPEGYEPSKAIINTGFLCTTWAAGDTYDTRCISAPGGTAVLTAIIYHD